MLGIDSHRLWACIFLISLPFTCIGRFSRRQLNTCAIKAAVVWGALPAEIECNDMLGNEWYRLCSIKLVRSPSFNNLGRFSRRSLNVWIMVLVSDWISTSGELFTAVIVVIMLIWYIIYIYGQYIIYYTKIRYLIIFAL